MLVDCPVEGDMDSGATLASGPTAPFQPSQPPFLTCKWDLFLCVCLERQYNEELIGPTADSRLWGKISVLSVHSWTVCP